MPIETRYKRSDLQTVNGVTTYILGLATSGTGIYQYISQNDPSSLYGYLGIRAYVLHADGTKTELTGGSPAAVITISVTESLPKAYSATWNCPQTSLASTDAILVEVYGQFAGYSWVLMARFVTEQLGTTILNAATWTVTYCGCRTATYSTVTGKYTNTLYFYWDGSYPSNIANFTWGILPIVSMPKLVKSGALPLHTIFIG
jgi:hypothetical protein